MPIRRFEPTEPYDLRETVRFLRTGRNDPTFRRTDTGFWRAATYAAGPATVHVRRDGPSIVAEAWGYGADDALDALPRLLGLHEAPWSLPEHPALRDGSRRHAGLRLTDTGDVFEALLSIVPQQLVTWAEAATTWRRLCERAGQPAPGPEPLLCPPTASDLRTLSLAEVEACGVARRRATTLVQCARAAGRLQEAAAMPTDEAFTRLTAVPGIGPWTAASVLGHRLARPDVLITGDYHLPNTVRWAFERRARGTEADLERLMEPFRGQRFRVTRLLMSMGVTAPKRGPRHPVRWH